MNADEFLKLLEKERLAGQTRESFRWKNRDKKIECKICKLNPDDKSKLDWHRINPLGKYDDANVICICEICHSKVHQVIKKMREDFKGEEIDYNTVLLMVALNLED